MKRMSDRERAEKCVADSPVNIYETNFVFLVDNIVSLIRRVRRDEREKAKEKT